MTQALSPAPVGGRTRRRRGGEGDDMLNMRGGRRSRRGGNPELEQVVGGRKSRQSRRQGKQGGKKTKSKKSKKSKTKSRRQKH